MQDSFKDVTHELYAVETSLSADPFMCRRYSELDRLTLLSNSDAHSAHRLGREVNLLDTELSYDAMFKAIKTKHGFLGTYEYYPQRGKYFNTGHRDCLASFDAQKIYDFNCPVCRKPLTVGVAQRVEDLANRTILEAESQMQLFKYVLPLPEIFAEFMGFKEVNPTVEKRYAKAISHFGNEFAILQQLPIADIQRYDHKLSVAIDRLQKDEKEYSAGYGVPGRIYFFGKQQLYIKPAQMVLF